MKKIIVFGATGGTGKQVVKQALENGYHLTVIVRNPVAFDMQHSQLEIINGDVLQSPTFENELEGRDAVISCLGTGKSTKPTTVYSTGIENIISAMNKASIKRLICISAGALYTNKEMGFFIRTLTKLVLQKILKEPYADMRLMETKVEKSRLDWTILRPARLTNKSFTGKYRVAVNSHNKRPFSISRADLAEYMLNSIDTPQTFKAKVEIAY